MGTEVKTKLQEVMIYYQGRTFKSQAEKIGGIIDQLFGQYQKAVVKDWGRYGVNAELSALAENKPVIFCGFEMIRHNENPQPEDAIIVIHIYDTGLNPSSTAKFSVFVSVPPGDLIETLEYGNIEDTAEQVAMKTYHYGIYRHPQKPTD